MKVNLVERLRASLQAHNQGGKICDPLEVRWVNGQIYDERTRGNNDASYGHAVGGSQFLIPMNRLLTRIAAQQVNNKCATHGARRIQLFWTEKQRAAREADKNSAAQKEKRLLHTRTSAHVFYFPLYRRLPHWRPLASCAKRRKHLPLATAGQQHTHQPRNFLFRISAKIA